MVVGKYANDTRDCSIREKCRMLNKKVNKKFDNKDGIKNMNKEIRAKELMVMFLEWFKEDFGYSYMLSDYMDMLDNGGWSDIKTYVGNFISEEIVKFNVSEFTDFEDNSTESKIWEDIQGANGDYLWKHFEEELWAFRDGFIKTYR